MKPALLNPNTENRETFRLLLKALDENRPLALIGAGVGVRAGYPSWGRLLQGLHERADREANWSPTERALLLQHEDLYWRAQGYKKILGEKAFKHYLSTRFSRKNKPIDAFTKALVRIGFSHFLTTNYDPSLESAYRSAF